MTRTKIRHAPGRHRPETVADRLEREQLAATQAGADQAVAEASTDLLPAIRLLAPIEQRLRELRRFTGINLTVDPNFVPGECEWCARGEITTVRVTGQPHGDDLHSPLEQAEVCHYCACSAYGPINQARIEQAAGSDRDIEVEVSA
jgi:hypothetical protein